MPELKIRNLFVSHSWDYKDHYDKVVGWFDDANNFNWKNYSVPIEKAFDKLKKTEFVLRIISSCNIFQL